MELMAIFREFSLLAGPAAVQALWQGGILTVALAIGLRFAPRISAGDHFRIWSAAFAALIVLPFLPLLGDLSIGSMRGAVGAGTASALAQPWINIDPRWSLAVAAMWLLISGWRVVDLLVHSWQLRRLWRNATPIETAGAEAEYEVCTTRELDRPSVIGFFAPRILIPDWLLERLSPEELAQVILHEAEHLRRRDDWTNLLQKIALVIFPLNPALVWVERRLCCEREMACDEGVVRRTRAPRAYAACLASLAERGLERRAEEALSLGAWQRRGELVERVHRILRRRPGLHPMAARTLLVVVGCGIVTASVEFARCPQLVGFTAAPQSIYLGQADEADALVNPGPTPVAGRVLTMARVSEGYRAVDAIAKMPSPAEMAAARMPRRRTGDRSPVAAPARERNPEAARQIATTDRHVLPSVAAEAPQQWVVFTAWEQIETTGQPPLRQSAPRNAAAGSASTAAAGSQADALVPVTRQITVTRLYLTVYPASAGSSRNGAKISNRRATAPLLPADGWLILQL